MELPETAAIARKHLQGTTVADRIDVVDGSFLDHPMPPGHDVVLLNNVVHLLSPARNIDLLGRIHPVVARGARLLMVDFWLDPGRTDPLFGALMAGEFLVMTGEGETYSAVETGEWLCQTRWKTIEHKPLAGPASLLVAEAV